MDLVATSWSDRRGCRRGICLLKRYSTRCISLVGRCRWDRKNDCGGSVSQLSTRGQG